MFYFFPYQIPEIKGKGYLGDLPTINLNRIKNWGSNRNASKYKVWSCSLNEIVCTIKFFTNLIIGSISHQHVQQISKLSCNLSYMHSWSWCNQLHYYYTLLPSAGQLLDLVPRNSFRYSQHIQFAHFQLAHVFTKALAWDWFQFLVGKLCMIDIYICSNLGWVFSSIVSHTY